MIAIDRGLLWTAFFLFLLANAPTFALFILDYDFGAGLVAFIRLIILFFLFNSFGNSRLMRMANHLSLHWAHMKILFISARPGGICRRIKCLMVVDDFSHECKWAGIHLQGFLDLDAKARHQAHPY